MKICQLLQPTWKVASTWGCYPRSDLMHNKQNHGIIAAMEHFPVWNCSLTGWKWPFPLSLELHHFPGRSRYRCFTGPSLMVSASDPSTAKMSAIISQLLLNSVFRWFTGITGGFDIALTSCCWGCNVLKHLSRQPTGRGHLDGDLPAPASTGATS